MSDLNSIVSGGGQKRDLKFVNYKFLDNSQTQKLLSIRNLLSVRKECTNQDEIKLQNHLKWIANLSGSAYFAVILDEQIIGGMSLVKIGEKNEWGVFFGENLPAFDKLFSSFVFLQEVFAKFDFITSSVKKSNSNAISFNHLYGLKEYKEDDEYFYLKLLRDDFLGLNDKVINKFKSSVSKFNIKFDEFV